jgi:hypothetical protein
MRVKIELGKAPHQNEENLAIIHMDYDPPHPNNWTENLLYNDLADILGGIRGLEKFYSLSYKIGVQKARVFSWEEVLPRVVDALCEFFNDQQVEIEEHAELIFNTQGQIK